MARDIVTGQVAAERAALATARHAPDVAVPWRPRAGWSDATPIAPSAPWTPSDDTGVVPWRGRAGW